MNSDVFKTWYPPLEKTLSCLSKLCNCLEPTVFTGLAQVSFTNSLWIHIIKISNLSFTCIKCWTKTFAVTLFADSCRSLLEIYSGCQWSLQSSFIHILSQLKSENTMIWFICLPSIKIRRRKMNGNDKDHICTYLHYNQFALGHEPLIQDIPIPLF